MTLQINDIITYKGNEFTLGSDPLNELLYTKNISTYSGNTANRRGYQCKWEIKNNSLYLIEILMSKLKMEVLFGTIEPLIANWYDGELILIDGYSVDIDGIPCSGESLSISITAGHVN